MPQQAFKGILPHLIYSPEHYEERERWGLIVFLHGRGERGKDLNLVKKWGLPKRLETDSHFPFFVLSPQCPDTTSWHAQTESVMALIDKFISSHPVDTTRIYLTGFSMGGMGTLEIAMQYPERFHAIAPVAGLMPFDTDKLTTLKDMPIWVFHSEKDEIVPIQQSETIIKTFRDMGSYKAKFTRYTDANHTQTADIAYYTEELYQWFLKQSI